MREKLETLKLDVLKDLAKEQGLKISSKTKDEIIDELIALDEAKKTESPKQVVETENKHIDYENPDFVKNNIGGSCEGILELVSESRCGFIRNENFLPSSNDIYVSNYQIRKYDLRTGDIIKGYKKIQLPTEKFPALLKIISVNGVDIDILNNRVNFDTLTPIFPNKKINILKNNEKSNALRMIDLLAPIGKGQRGLIVSPPKAGKTTLLYQLAQSILENEKDMHLIVLLVDERPEEVTEMKEKVKDGKNVDVIYSTFDELPERHKRVSEMVIERAKRLVELKKDVIILLDSLTRLTRAYNLAVPASGRTLSGGLDPNSLHMPKKFFGAARNLREGGSLTIIATALVDTGSRMDDVIYEEFKGTGNMELVLNRKLQERRVFPAIDIQKSGTRKEELLLSEQEFNAATVIHRLINLKDPEEITETVISICDKTKDKFEFIKEVLIMESNYDEKRNPNKI